MSDSEEPLGFDLGEPPQPESSGAYRVLARKYRSQRFSELIGQDAMVQTLGNAIKRGRLAHAFILTGVRGVGKTSTARLIAKALNCDVGPTLETCGTCDACVAITEGRHIDVIEMDAASHTGVDNIREIIEAARYAAVTARYKIYIIDEVHMLSKNAFNALLKTLEEPPAHVKFLFATTEIQKVPVTVLSRCMRFDLRRIPAELLSAHFDGICKAENVSADPEALALIARAADGSVRDGLSILEQAIAHADMEGAGLITGEQVRNMLGLADGGAVRDLFHTILAADPKAALAAMDHQHQLGVDPISMVKSLLNICHATTLVKTGASPPGGGDEATLAQYDHWAANLSFAQLHRLWQLLLKGHDELNRAPDLRDAADMLILRLIHASHMPDPGELLRKLEHSPAGAPASASTHAASPAISAQVYTPHDFEALVTHLQENGHALIAHQLHDYVGLVAFEPGKLTLRPSKPLPTEFARDVTNVIRAVTGAIWTVTLSDHEAQPSLRDQELASEQAARDAILATPVIAAALQAFPEAELLTQEGQTLQ